MLSIHKFAHQKKHAVYTPAHQQVSSYFTPSAVCACRGDCRRRIEMETRSMPSYWPHLLFMAFYGHFHAVIGLIKFRGRLVFIMLHAAIGFPPLLPCMCTLFIMTLADVNHCKMDLS